MEIQEKKHMVNGHATDVRNQETAKTEIIDEDEWEDMDVDDPKPLPRLTKRKRGSHVKWSKEEIILLAEGLQEHGMGEIEEIAKSIQTKSPSEVLNFLNKLNAETRRRKNVDRPYCFSNWKTPTDEHIQHWPNVRKWQKAILGFCSNIRRQDVSFPIIGELLEKFYLEAPEPAHPQMVNFKAMYKYLLDCMDSKIPAELNPATYMTLGTAFLQLKELADMNAEEIAEEVTFLKNFQKPTQYFLEVKKEDDDEDPKNLSNAVPIPPQLFDKLTSHKHLVDGMNPLQVHGWLIAKEQSLLSDQI